MSTTTDIPRRHPVAAFVWQCLLVLAVWLALASLITVVWEPLEEAIVFGSPDKTLAYLHDSDTRIMELAPSYLIVRGTQRGFVRRLYANGAWIVLPARAGGCFTPAPPPS